MNYIKIFLILFVINSQAFALDLTVKIPIYKTLSKTNTSIPGSTSIIIDKEDLIKYNNEPIHAIIDKESGIKSRSIYGDNSSGSKTTLDIRGMGAQAKSNVLILINGQRLNNIDMSEIDFPAIPKDSIDRIEIIKGNAASVLYGDGAIGGAINIITNPDSYNKNINEINLKTGSYNKREINWINTNKINQYIFNTYLSHNQTDGYRDENEQQQNNITSELKFSKEKGDHLFVFNFSEQIMSTPSDRDQNQLYSDRRGSDTPDDFINSEGGSVLYSSDYRIDDYKTFLLNSSFRLKDSYSDLQSTNYPSYNDTNLTNYQLSPRIDHLIHFFNKPTNSTYGLDIQYADYKSYRKKSKYAIPLHEYDAEHFVQSIYIQNSSQLNNKTNLSTGFRFQMNNIKITDILNTSAPDYAGWQTEHESFNNKEKNYAFNLGIDKKITVKSTIYSRIGKGFRYPNIDDRIGGSGDTSLELSTQTSQDYEIGIKYLNNNFLFNISSYLVDGDNELSYDTDAFQNININSTRRYGVELNSKYKISNKLNFTNNFTFAKAKYTSGNQGTYATNFKDKDVPLVPQYSLDSILEYKISDFFQIIPSINYQDDMRMESDDENFQHTKIPTHLITNIKAIVQFGKFSGYLSIKNLFDKKYHNYAVASSSTQGAYNAYPEPGREIVFSLKNKF